MPYCSEFNCGNECGKYWLVWLFSKLNPNPLSSIFLFGEVRLLADRKLQQYSNLKHNARMDTRDIHTVLKTTGKSLLLRDERRRAMRFPRRRDYIKHLKEHGFIADESDFIENDLLTKAAYLDWLRRPQVGCVFAQLLARPKNRTQVETKVARYSSAVRNPKELAIDIAGMAKTSIHDASDEALSILLPEVLNDEELTRLVWELSHQTGWEIEREHMWRGTLVLVGLRVEIDTKAVAETLGMGPFDIFPPTRQCPITTLEIRTKSRGAKKSHLSKTHLASHLADIPTHHMLTRGAHRSLFARFTPWLKKRILGHQEDMRAKAGVTYSLPAPIWQSLKDKAAEHIEARD